MKNAVPLLISLLLNASLAYCQQPSKNLGGSNAKAKAPNESSFSAQTQTDNDFTFKVTGVQGDRKGQTVTVVLMVTTNGPNKERYNTFRLRSFISDEGEEFELKSFLLGVNNTPKTLFTGVPMKTVYVFKGVLPKVSAIKLLPVPYSSDFDKHNGRVEFRDLPINWK